MVVCLWFRLSVFLLRVRLFRFSCFSVPSCLYYDNRTLAYMFSVFVVERVYSLLLFCGCVLCFYLFLCGFFFGFCVCLSAVPAWSGALSGLKIRFVCACFLVYFFLLDARVLRGGRVVCVERLFRWVARILRFCACFFMFHLSFFLLLLLLLLCCVLRLAWSWSCVSSS